MTFLFESAKLKVQYNSQYIREDNYIGVFPYMSVFNNTVSVALELSTY